MKSVRLGNRDGQPDYVQQKVQNDDTGCQSKYCLVSLGIKIIHPYSDTEETFREDPLDSAEANVIDISREVDVEDRKL